MRNTYYVYILASRPHGAIYVGVTNNLDRRVGEHRDGIAGQHTQTYKIKKLVYYEIFDRIDDAITREKQIKKWNRAWKVRLIEEKNSKWKDLANC